MATLIGLCIRVKLLRSLPERFKVDIMVTPGTHASEEAGRIISKLSTWNLTDPPFVVNKQLNDKERVAAALENGHLIREY